MIDRMRSIIAHLREAIHWLEARVFLQFLHGIGRDAVVTERRDQGLRLPLPFIDDSEPRL